jgi:D-alanyl-D-alanine carboxypeptidase
MSQKAKEDGCNIYIVSGFRSKEYQYNPFVKNKKQANENSEMSNKALFDSMTVKEKQDRARWSAIPGYSEHHTGYAIDIVNVNSSFANTKEYQRLKNNAKDFGFEVSFPKNNQQGVGFEPRHRRYIGSANAKKVFQRAQNM